MPSVLSGTLGGYLLIKFDLSWTLAFIHIKIREVKIFFLEYTGLPACMSVHNSLAWCP